MTTASKKGIAQVIAYAPYRGQRGPDELVAWLEASVVGNFALPATVQTLVDAAVHLQGQRAMLVRPDAVAVPAKAALTMTAGEVLAANDAAAAATARYAREVDVVTRGEAVLEHTCMSTFGAERDNLIRGPLRRAVADILDKAREVAGELRKYAPSFTDGLLGAGTPQELQRWRDSRELQSTFHILQACWLLSFRHAGVAGGMIDNSLVPERPGGYYAWADPDAVRPEALRNGDDRELLRVASAASAYQLRAPSELVSLLAEMNAAAAPGQASPLSTVKAGVCATGR
jgi:hypothetical protein